MDLIAVSGIELAEDETAFNNHPVEDSSGDRSAGGCSQASCGGSGSQLSHLSESVQAKIRNHPCYSEDAHHYFARMHVAVAPACNIQCHYCNRKYDCSNESRPGVVSELLTPEQAVMKAKAVAAKIPQMSVLGIAGPGDPLANPQRTFATFRQLSEQAPDIKLCVSTNGLALPDSVEELSQHNIEHVTITINAVDPKVGAKIYPWIFWNNRRVFGEKAAAILIRQQQKGLEMLIEKGILVKVNSVMIPGVNDKHLQEVSRIVKQKGAFLHNVMPLISEPEHGTFYGLMGQRAPSQEELQALQDACSGDMNMMRHCRQCRADAVGMLGQDRGDEFTLEKIADMDIDYDKAMVVRSAVHAGIEQELRQKRETLTMPSSTAEPTISIQSTLLIQPSLSAQPGPPPHSTRSVLMAVATKGQDMINQHFGHATEFLVYEASVEKVRFIGHRKVDQYCVGESTCGEKESALSNSIRALQGCEVVLCAKIGFEPWEQLEASGIQPNGEHAMEPIEDAVRAVYQEMLTMGLLDDHANKDSSVAIA